MEKQYVDVYDGGYKIAGSRVSLDSVVIAFLQGLSPESIATDCFPTLTLEQVYGAITYYLAHRDEIDSYLENSDREYAALRDEARHANPRLASKLSEARRHVPRAHR
jgi:uncharacterized protein (DUF433 family)